jgi:cbb3-type cytochrome oxidase subunit 3
MRSMFLEYFAKSPALFLPILALVIFIAIFGAVAVRTWRRGNAAFAEQARLPLDDDEGGRR